MADPSQVPRLASAKARQLLEEDETDERYRHRAEAVAKIVEGFAINDMTIRNAETGQVLWESADWKNTFRDEIEIHIPPEVLSCSVISREMNFSSREKIDNFRLVQLVSLNGQPIEEWMFPFGFVIPGSTNSWSVTIRASPSGPLPVEILSGNIVLETSFYDNDMFVCKSRIRIFYDAPSVELIERPESNE